MAKITLTAEEELMYLERLEEIQELMPDLEIEVVTRPVMLRTAINSNLGESFRQFLKGTTISMSSADYRAQA
ncbi:MAG: hypothetical protein JST76_06215 [Bacteroidetes bacterium]|nr:hypothetical protein [Bacteroidota bacterium]